MKILLVLGRYLPEKRGGIENYSHQLGTLLMRNNHEVHAGILHGRNDKKYIFEGIEIFNLGNSLDNLIKLLAANQYDICHFHEYSGKNGINIKWIKTAKQYAKKVFFTFHLPYLTCYKNDFRFKGVENCDDFSLVKRCAVCVMATRLHYKKTTSFSVRNTVINLLLPALSNSGKVLELKKNIQDAKNDLTGLMDTCDQVFIIAEWFRNILTRNGIQSPKLKTISPINSVPAYVEQYKSGLSKKIVFVGRIEKQKGLHLLCKAMNIINPGGIKLDVFGNIVDENYFKNCEKEYAFNYKGVANHSDLLKLFHDYDFLILPSVFTEMYPMVIQEAFSENLPVIASGAKGNADLIKEGKNGFIFEYDSFKDLAAKIDKAYILKTSGWQPVFENEDGGIHDGSELLSYYSISDKIFDTVKNVD